MGVTTESSASFNVTSGNSHTFTLSIPQGTLGALWDSAVWTVVGQSGSGTTTNYILTPSEVSPVTSPGSHTAVGNWIEPLTTSPPTSPTPASVIQMQDINAIAGSGGGTMTCTWNGVNGENNVVVTLQLTPANITQAVSPGLFGGSPGGDNASGLSGNPFSGVGMSGTKITETVNDAQAMAARVHRQATRCQNECELWYLDRSNATWYLFPIQPVFDSKNGLKRSVKYNQPSTLEFGLVDPQGLLTRQNQQSSYNYNQSGAYDPILDEARMVTFRVGAWCYGNVASGLTASTATDGTASTAGALSRLTDGTLNSYAAGTSNCVVITKGTSTYYDFIFDLGSPTLVQHAVIRFGSRAGTTVLPISVTPAYSADNTNWNLLNTRPVGGGGSAGVPPGDWDENYQGIAVEVAFADIEVTIRYVRMRIVLPASGTVAVDELAIYGGTTQTILGRCHFTGYLGDQIEVDALGLIRVRATDVCKRLYDNNSNPLTANYFTSNTGTVELADIAYSLLTSTAYWRGTGTAYNAPWNTSFIGWQNGVGYTGFGLPIWQGQTNSMWGYELELWKSIGWRFYADGTGTLNARDTAYTQTSPDRLFICANDGNQDCRMLQRHVTGTDLRNYVVVTSSQAVDPGSGTVTMFDPNSVARYGPRLFKIADPMAITLQIRQKIAQYALRDYAWRTETLTAEIAPDFDTDIRQIHAFRAPQRPCVFAKASTATGQKRLRELWLCQSITETIGVSEWWASAEYTQYVPLSTLPPNFTSITPGTASGGFATVTLNWTLIVDPKVASINVYKSTTSADGPFSFVANITPPTTITVSYSLSTSSTDWFYLTTVDAFGVESLPSGVLSVTPGSAGTTWNSDYYVSDLAVGYIGVSGPDAHGVYTYQFYATWTSPSNGGFTQYYAHADTRNPAGQPWALNPYLWQIGVAHWWGSNRIPPGKMWDRVTAGELDANWYVRTTQNLSGSSLTLYFRLWTSLKTTSWTPTLGIASNSVAVSIP